MAEETEDLWEQKIREIVEYLERRYEPVYISTEADITISNDQLIEQLTDFYGEIDKFSLIAMMKAAGFRYTDINLQFYWLIRKREDHF